MWIKLEQVSDIEIIKNSSQSKPIIIFKHSTRCGISSMVLSRFEKLMISYQHQIELYYLDLLRFREISNQLEKIFEVEHQSPQILIIKNENCVFNASHYDILEIDFERFL